jgi:hypothetical protein
MPSEYDEIRSLVIPRRLLDHYTIQYREVSTKEGSVLEAACPFCKKAKSFKMYENGGWLCFACDHAKREPSKGGCFDFVMHVEKVPLLKAKELLRQMFSASPPAPPKARRYMEVIDEWLDALVVLQAGETPDAWKKRVKNAIKGKLIESFKNGQKEKSPSR